MSDTPRVDEYIRAYNEKEKWARDMSPVELAEQLERENAALREAGHLAEKIIVQRTDEIRHLERENAELRAESKLLNAAQKISEETDEPIIRDILSLRAKVDELERENAEELRRVRADKTEVLGKLAQVERENEKLRAELWSARRQLDDSMRPSHEDLEGAFEWLRKNAPVSIRYMTGNEQWSLPPAYCVLVKDRLFYGTTVFHAVREAMLSET